MYSRQSTGVQPLALVTWPCVAKWGVLRELMVCEAEVVEAPACGVGLSGFNSRHTPLGVLQDSTQLLQRTCAHLVEWPKTRCGARAAGQLLQVVRKPYPHLPSYASGEADPLSMG